MPESRDARLVRPPDSQHTTPLRLVPIRLRALRYLRVLPLSKPVKRASQLPAPGDRREPGVTRHIKESCGAAKQYSLLPEGSISGKPHARGKATAWGVSQATKTLDLARGHLPFLHASDYSAHHHQHRNLRLPVKGLLRFQFCFNFIKIIFHPHFILI